MGVECFKADLHIHTCLSPCGHLEMSPRKIVESALERGLDIIAITDHNTTRNVRPCVEIGDELGLYVVAGCEVNTQEEVHCLCFFPDIETLEAFQEYLDAKIPDIANDPLLFGYQVAVDKDDAIIFEEKRSLFTGICDEIEGLQQQVDSLGGLFVPAHVDRMKNGIFGQLGFIPPGLRYDALEISRRVNYGDFLRSHPALVRERILQSSDAHMLEQIAAVHTLFYMERADWNSFSNAFGKQPHNRRMIKIPIGDG
jgi:PHP family Zn ribbon phosphoesterase